MYHLASCINSVEQRVRFITNPSNTPLIGFSTLPAPKCNWYCRFIWKLMCMISLWQFWSDLFLLLFDSFPSIAFEWLVATKLTFLTTTASVWHFNGYNWYYTFNWVLMNHWFPLWFNRSLFPRCSWENTFRKFARNVPILLQKGTSPEEKLTKVLSHSKPPYKNEKKW